MLGSNEANAYGVISQRNQDTYMYFKKRGRQIDNSKNLRIWRICKQIIFQQIWSKYPTLNVRNLNDGVGLRFHKI